MVFGCVFSCFFFVKQHDVYGHDSMMNHRGTKALAVARPPQFTENLGHPR